MQRFGEGLACASPGCTSGFSLSPRATRLVSVAHPPSGTLVGLFSQGMLQASPSPRAMPTHSPGAGSQMPSPSGTALQTMESSLLAEVSLHRRSAGKGALMQRACALASLFNSAICQLSKISQWEEQRHLKLLRLVLICSRVLFPCPRLSAWSHPEGCGGGQPGCPVWSGGQQLFPQPRGPVGPARVFGGGDGRLGALVLPAGFLWPGALPGGQGWVQGAPWAQLCGVCVWDLLLDCSTQAVLHPAAPGREPRAVGLRSSL